MKLHLTKPLLAALLLATGFSYAEDMILTKQTVEGSYANQKYLERIDTTKEWAGNKEETVNYSGNTINYTASGTSPSHAVLSLHSDNYNNTAKIPNHTVSGYGDVSFDNNTVSANVTQGAAVHMEGSANKSHANTVLTVKGNGIVSFDNNTSTANTNQAHGGALYVGGNSDAALTGNDQLSFKNNSLESKSYAYGGAIYVKCGVNNASNGKVSSLTISGNGDVSFNGNTAVNTDKSYAQGGAIYADKETTVNINGNTGKVEFIGNGVKSAGSYCKGGAIFSGTGSTLYYADENYLSIRGNNEVVFSGNYEIDTKNDTYRLRSIYAGSELKLSANQGGKIEINDSIYSQKALSLNEDYDGKAQSGTIIFSGKNTEATLNAVIAANTAEGATAREATATEIANSRTSVVEGTITLHNGTLSLQDDAVLQATKLIIKEGATLEGKRTEAEAAMVFAMSAEDEAVLESVATLNAALELEDGAMVNMVGGGIDLNGKALTMGRNVQVTFDADAADGENVVLFKNVGRVTGNATEFELTLNGKTTTATLSGGNVVVEYTAAAVPEPTTATLSLLALAALAARRRRK